MDDSEPDPEVVEASGLSGYSPSFTRTVVEKVGPVLRRYFRAELHGLDVFPQPGAYWSCPTTPAEC